MKTLRQARKERLAQRMSTVPRKVTQGDTLYDRVLALGSLLEDVITNDDAVGNENERNLAAFKEKVNTYYDQATDENVKDMLDTVIQLLDGISVASTDNSYIKDVEFELQSIAKEIKQVALDTHGGTTSPIDLGEWLY